MIQTTKIPRSEVRREISKRVCEGSLHEFVRQAWHVLEPHTEFVDGPHIALICTKLEAVTRGELHRVIINIPPGMMKSMLVSVLWPCWEWTRAPHLRYNFFSYAQDLSTDHSRARRKLLTSRWYTRRWPNVKLAPDNNQATQFSSTTSPGMMVASSVGGVATGRGGERLVVDDPMNPRMAHSETERETVTRWFRQTLPSRLRSATGAVVLIMQRLHEEDPTALALAMGADCHLCLPMRFDPEHPHLCAEDWRTTKGELLCPDRFDDAYCQQLERDQGPYAWAGQYQQLPAPLGGGMFKRQWFRYAEKNGAPDLYKLGEHGWRNVQGARRFLTVDLATSTKETGDYTVIMAWAMWGELLLLLDVMRERLEGPDILPQIALMLNRHRAGDAWIEKIGFQTSLIQDGARKGLPVRELRPDKDKATRAAPMAAAMANGKVFFAPGTWNGALEAELLSFPAGGHDDQVDAFAYGERVRHEAAGWGVTRTALY